MHALFHRDLKEPSVGATKKKNLFLYNACYASICSFAVSMGKTTIFLSQYPSLSLCLSCAMQPTAATSADINNEETGPLPIPAQCRNNSSSGQDQEI